MKAYPSMPRSDAKIRTLERRGKDFKMADTGGRFFLMKASGSKSWRVTYDRGSEMTCHPERTRCLKIDIWFCDPHAPWPWPKKSGPAVQPLQYMLEAKQIFLIWQ